MQIRRNFGGWVVLIRLYLKTSERIFTDVNKGRNDWLSSGAGRIVSIRRFAPEIINTFSGDFLFTAINHGGSSGLLSPRSYFYWNNVFQVYKLSFFKRVQLGLYTQFHFSTCNWSSPLIIASFRTQNFRKWDLVRSTSFPCSEYNGSLGYFRANASIFPCWSLVVRLIYLLWFSINWFQECNNFSILKRIECGINCGSSGGSCLFLLEPRFSK